VTAATGTATCCKSGQAIEWRMTLLNASNIVVAYLGHYWSSYDQQFTSSPETAFAAQLSPIAGKRIPAGPKKLDETENKRSHIPHPATVFTAAAGSNSVCVYD
jgi:hypothetical protein